jgi:phosphorylcholine metabolism protein LicD
MDQSAMELSIFDDATQNEVENCSNEVCDESLLQQNNNAGTIPNSTSFKKKGKESSTTHTRTKRIHKRAMIEKEEMREKKESMSRFYSTVCFKMYDLFSLS